MYTFSEKIFYVHIIQFIHIIINCFCENVNNSECILYVEKVLRKSIEYQQ